VASLQEAILSVAFKPDLGFSVATARRALHDQVDDSVTVLTPVRGPLVGVVYDFVPVWDEWEPFPIVSSIRVLIIVVFDLDHVVPATTVSFVVAVHLDDFIVH
jgi:hypothetical protein